MTRQLILVRHGQTDANAQGRTIAVTDPPLNQKGMEQANQLSRVLESTTVDRIITSPRLRCTQTAEAILNGQGTSPALLLDERLIEIGMGGFEGHSVEEIRASGMGEVFAAWRQGSPPMYPEGAERFETAAARLSELFGEIAHGEAGTTVLVGHSHALRILIATCILGGDPELHRRLYLDHATVTSVFWEGSIPRLAALNKSTALNSQSPPVAQAFSTGKTSAIPGE